VKGNKILYCPALRMKAGELSGVRELAPDVAAHVLPRFIVPPPGERDDDQPELFKLDNTPDVGALLSRHWFNRPAFIDSTHLIIERGRDDLASWLPEMFHRARGLGVIAIPMAMLSDLGQLELDAFKQCISSEAALKFCICLKSGDIVDPQLVGTTLSLAVEKLGLHPSECAVIADFSDSEFSAPDLVAPIIGGALELLQQLGQWQHVIFQGTNYPEKNPATHGTSELWPRSEWTAWQQAVRFDPATAEHMIFGDYAADCSKMVFGGSGGKAIRHYRYTTKTDWFVVRGAEEGTHKEVMEDICARIVTSEHFAGEPFSSADAYIALTAQGLDGPGSSTIWRQVNTTHHVTRVVVDVAEVRGIDIAKRPVAPTSFQLSLLS